jgi:hypothetical protein
LGPPTSLYFDYNRQPYHACQQRRANEPGEKGETPCLVAARQLHQIAEDPTDAGYTPIYS